MSEPLASNGPTTYFQAVGKKRARGGIEPATTIFRQSLNEPLFEIL
jgi:hypothetical protein